MLTLHMFSLVKTCFLYTFWITRFVPRISSLGSEVARVQVFVYTLHEICKVSFLRPQHKQCYFRPPSVRQNVLGNYPFYHIILPRTRHVWEKDSLSCTWFWVGRSRHTDTGTVCCRRLRISSGTCVNNTVCTREKCIMRLEQSKTSFVLSRCLWLLLCWAFSCVWRPRTWSKTY